MERITAQQAAEAAQGLTFEEVWAALMEMKESQKETQKETQKSLDESQKRIERNFAESQKRIEEANAESKKRIEETNAESKKRIEETNAESQKRIEEANAESQKRVDKNLADFQRSMDKTLKDLSRNIGGIGNSLGRLTESLFTAELWKKFNDLGIPVTRQCNQMKFGDGKQVLAEVDLFIENGEYAILVEIKTDMHVSHVDDHLERIEIVRRCLDERNDNRKLLGAIAGGTVAENVAKYAQRKGLYVVIQTGDAIALADMPQGFKPREW